MLGEVGDSYLDLESSLPGSGLAMDSALTQESRKATQAVRRRHCPLKCQTSFKRDSEGESRFLRRCRKNCHVVGWKKPGGGSLDFAPTPTTSLIVFQTPVPIQMQTPGGAFALRPGALEEIDSSCLLVRLG